MTSWLESLYYGTPVWLQQVGVNLYGWYWGRRRLGPFFEKTWREYVERELWPPEKMHEFVENQLRSQVQRAYREVPYYRRAFRDAGLTEVTISRFTVADLVKIPRLEKEYVRQNADALLTKEASEHKPRRFHSSGSTGAPIPVYMDGVMHQHTIAVREARSFRWAGVSYRDSRCTLGGRLVSSPSQTSPPFWRYNRWERQLYLSAHRMGRETVSDYVAAINHFRPVTLIGYATAVHVFAKLIRDMRLKVSSPRAVITTAERLEPHMRPVIEESFGTKVFEEYGSAENCALATECEHGRMHFHPDFGYVEIVRSDGKPAQAGELGELLVTGFANTKHIFVRYRIGDLAAWACESCPCGRDSLPVIGDLIGRVEDIVVAPDGREIVRMHYIFLELPGVLEGQVVQEDLFRYVFNVVPGPHYSADETGKRIREVFQARFGLGQEVGIELREVPLIARGPNGKFRAVINKLGRTAVRL